MTTLITAAKETTIIFNVQILYDIIAIKKGHFGCLPVALPCSKTSLAYARNYLSRLIRVPFADVPRSTLPLPVHIYI